MRDGFDVPHPRLSTGSVRCTAKYLRSARIFSARYLNVVLRFFFRFDGL